MAPLLCFTLRWATNQQASKQKIIESKTTLTSPKRWGNFPTALFTYAYLFLHCELNSILELNACWPVTEHYFNNEAFHCVLSSISVFTSCKMGQTFSLVFISAFPQMLVCFIVLLQWGIFTIPGKPAQIINSPYGSVQSCSKCLFNYVK